MSCSRVLKLFLLSAAVSTSSGCDTFSPFAGSQADAEVNDADLLWVEIMPTQCLTNPWQQEWLKLHGNDYDQYPRAREREVLRDFFLKRGVSFYDYRTEQVWEAVCAACSCPGGHVLFLRIHQRDLPLLQQLGFRLSGANLQLKIDKAHFPGEEAITFRLINSSSYSFTANGEDGYGLAGLLVVQGSDFIVQQEVNGYWHSLALPPAFEGIRRFTITPGDSMRGYWLNHQKLSGKFRLILRLQAAGADSSEGYVISESFTSGNDFILFDPEPDSLDFGEGYALHAEATALDGDFLRTAVSYSGGCEVHEFKVRLNRVENLTAYIFIHHNANGDLCEAYPTTSLRANLSALLVRDDWDKLVLLAPSGVEITLVRK